MIAISGTHVVSGYNLKSGICTPFSGTEKRRHLRIKSCNPRVDVISRIYFTTLKKSLVEPLVMELFFFFWLSELMKNVETQFCKAVQPSVIMSKTHSILFFELFHDFATEYRAQRIWRHFRYFVSTSVWTKLLIFLWIFQ